MESKAIRNKSVMQLYHTPRRYDQEFLRREGAYIVGRQSSVRSGQGGRLTFKPNKTLGGNWEGKAPAEAFTHQARQEPRTPVEIASNLKKKVRRPPSPNRTVKLGIRGSPIRTIKHGGRSIGPDYRTDRA